MIDTTFEKEFGNSMKKRIIFSIKTVFLYHSAPLAAQAEEIAWSPRASRAN